MVEAVGFSETTVSTKPHDVTSRESNLHIHCRPKLVILVKMCPVYSSGLRNWSAANSVCSRRPCIIDVSVNSLGTACQWVCNGLGEEDANPNVGRVLCAGIEIDNRLTHILFSYQ